MTREDQIKKQADIYTDDSSNYTEWFDEWSDTNDIELVEKAFIEGAKWADKHPNLSEEEQVGMGGLGMIWQKKELIKKACDWLKKILYIHTEFDTDIVWGTTDVTEWVTSDHDSVNEFIEAFKKAMEE